MRESVTAQHEAGDFHSLGAAVRSFSRQGASAVRDGVMADVRTLVTAQPVVSDGAVASALERLSEGRPGAKSLLQQTLMPE